MRAYFSALYGPARHAIVVRDLNAVREQLRAIREIALMIYI